MNAKHANAMQLLTNADYRLGNSNINDLELLLRKLEKEDYSGCVGVRNTIANVKNLQSK